MSDEISKVLRSAVENGRVSLVDELLSCGTCVETLYDSNRSALHLASRRGQVGVVKRLIVAGASTDGQDMQGYTALHWAAWRNYPESVRLLTMGAADVSLRDKVGRTPLHEAAFGGHYESVQWLLKASANPDLKDEKLGWSATHKAADQGHTDVLRLLLAANADPDLRTKAGETVLHIAAERGHSDAISLLVSSGADPNSVTASKSSPLHLAAAMGHEEAVLRLLQLGCDPALIDSAGLSAAAAACCFGHSRILLIMLHKTEHLQLPSALQIELQASRDQPQCVTLEDVQSAAVGLAAYDERDLSSSLHICLKEAGFSQSRAIAHSALADVLQDILRERLSSNLFLVGSYSDGWGNSLVSLNGVTDSDADIDETVIDMDRVFHIRGECKCESLTTEDIVEYNNGHVVFLGSEGTPAQSYIGSSLRPAIDIISSYKCCCYPRIELLSEEYKTNFSPAVLDSLRQECLQSPCHLVSAAPPGEKGQRLRVSTSFLERRVMRSLNDVQGHVFLLLKFLVKKALVLRAAHSLKTYHAKTMLFYLLDETPADLWQPSNVIYLARRGLQKLLESLEDNSDPNKCMTHFFLRDASLYLKTDHYRKEDVAIAVKKLMEELPTLVHQFMRQLRPLTENGVFRFHPFLILPDPKGKLVPESGQLPYHSVSDSVRSLLMIITAESIGPGTDVAGLLDNIKRIGNYAATAKQCLLVMMYLKIDRPEEAIKILRESLRLEVSRGVPCPESVSIDKDTILRHLESTDSAWKFCFQFEDRAPELGFLPEFINRNFPCQFLYVTWHYMNMRALLRCICLSLPQRVSSEATWKKWFVEVLDSDDPDVQELLMVLEFCLDMDLLVSLIHRHRQRICSIDQVRLKVEDRLRSDTKLMHHSMRKTIETALSDANGISTCKRRRLMNNELVS